MNRVHYASAMVRDVSRVGLGVVLGAAILSGRTAQADGPKDRSNSQFHLERNTEMVQATKAANERAAAGDCAGALSAFDVAVRINRDPVLRRDRGLCHEKLGHPFPAMDDYRAYLASMPQAADWEDIRHRLVALEDEHARAEREKPKDDARAGISLNVRVNGKSGEGSSKNADIDAVNRDEEVADQAYESPLRLGTGPVVGVYFGLRQFVGGSAPSGLGYAGGFALRHSFGRVVSLVGEIGYVSIDNTYGFADGLGMHVGLEFRAALNRYGSDSLVFGFGPGHENYRDSVTTASSSVFLGRARLGYRHVFGPSIGVELSFDPAVALVHPYNLPFGVPADDRIEGLLGGSLGLVVGF